MKELPWELIIQLLSWALIFYLHLRNLRKTETSKLKDNILTSLSQLPEIFCKKIDSNSVNVLDAE